MQLMDGTQDRRSELIVDHLEDEPATSTPAPCSAWSWRCTRAGSSIPPRPTCRRWSATISIRASPGRRKLREFARNLQIGWDGAERFVAGALPRRTAGSFFRPCP